MSAKKWVKMDLDDIENTGTENNNPPLAVYGLGGKRYPRLAICVRRYDPGIEPSRNIADPIRLSSSYKRDEESWWESCGIPFEVLGEVLAMLGSVTRDHPPK